MPRPLLLFAISLALAACAGGVSERAHLQPAPAATTAGARIVSAGKPLECVAYARKASAVSIRGDAWTWWRSAKGRYRRDNRPAVGSVLVLRRSNRLRLGHLAVVTRVVSKREIIVDHANWLNRGKVHLGTPVRDVSAAGDWSAVRVWYTPGRTLGRRTYPAYGFIHPTPATT